VIDWALALAQMESKMREDQIKDAQEKAKRNARR